MARLPILVLALLLAAAAQAATIRHDLLVHFDKDQSTLTEETIAALEGFLAGTDLSGDYTLEVRGYTDSDGAEAYNAALSLARAQAVRDRLVAWGADPALITVGCSGEHDPLASNGNAEGMAENRRVSVRYVQHRFADADELRQALVEGSAQHFTLDPSQAQVVRGAGGVELAIPANAFVDALGRPAQGPVDLTLTEALDLQAMLGHDLSTQCGTRLLETGGMFDVQATDVKGTPLKLDAAMPMRIAVPTATKKEGMQLFRSSNGADWSVTGQPLATRTITRWEERPFPVQQHVPFKFPRYVEDRKGRPLKPGEPIAPKPPMPPRRSSYDGGRPWWGVLFPEKAAAHSHARYEAALQRYAQQLERYNARQAEFEQACADYPNALERHAARMADWKAKKQAEREAWDRDVMAPAKATYDSLMVPYRAAFECAVEQWRADRAASMQRYVERADSTGTLDMSGLGAYVFSTTEMGWINCDRFMATPPEELYNVRVMDAPHTPGRAFLVFTHIRSLMALEPMPGGDLISGAVPRTEPVTLFAYTVIDGRVHVCMETVDPTKVVRIQYRPSSFAEVQRLLKELGANAA